MLSLITALWVQWLISDPTPFLHTSVKVFLEVPSKPLPSTKIQQYLRLLLLLWILCSCFSLGGGQADGEQECFLQACKSGFQERGNRGNRKMRLGHISWAWLKCHTLFQHFRLGRIRLLYLPNCSQWRRMHVGETHFVLNSSLSSLHRLPSRPGLRYPLPWNH